MVVSLRRYLVLLFGISNIFLVGFRYYKNFLPALAAIRQLFNFRKKVHNNKSWPKIYLANGKYFISINVPGFPSLAFNKHIKNELTISRPFTNHTGHLQLAVFSITCRCPLKCRHCFEWERINGSEFLSLNQLKKIQQKIEAYGVCLIQYTGGEPMVRINDLIELLKVKSSTIDSWIFSSGYNLTRENAMRLRNAGLTGVVLSLDHWDAKKHNSFRKSDLAFNWVVSAAENVVQANLAFSLSLCATREFVSRDNLFKYLYLAQKLNAGFIQILEPRKVGRFNYEDVSLNSEQVKTIEDFMTEVNNNQEYKKMPAIIFPGYHQRKFGCSGAGHRFIYVDSKGDIHACPFCQEAGGNCLQNELPLLIDKLKIKGCHEFSKVLLS
jgi:MoaA/NifB/PqqE/SkfB family radical SAM enzyme